MGSTGMIDRVDLWTVIIGLGIGSFGLRFVFLGLVGELLVGCSRRCKGSGVRERELSDFKHAGELRRLLADDVRVAAPDGSVPDEPGLLVSAWKKVGNVKLTD